LRHLEHTQCQAEMFQSVLNFSGAIG
jgi:hypothetical protein